MGNEEKTNSKEFAKIQDSSEGVIITISRTHGSRGKYIGQLIAKQLNIPYYYKELTVIAALANFLAPLNLNIYLEYQFLVQPIISAVADLQELLLQFQVIILYL